MNPRSRLTAAAFAALSLACGDIASPSRADIYEWRLEAAPPSGEGIDTVSFHWPAERLPVRIWVEQTDPLPADVAGGISVWRGQFLYGEYDATVVSDSNAADVIVTTGIQPDTRLSTVRLHSALAPQCAGATDIDLSEDNTQLLLPIRIHIDPTSTPDTPGLGECLALTVTHELGHSLGIFRHSPNPTDLMYFNPVRAGSERARPPDRGSDLPRALHRRGGRPVTGLPAAVALGLKPADNSGRKPADTDGGRVLCRAAPRRRSV